MVWLASVAVLVVLVVVLAFFSAAESAFLSISRVRLHRLISKSAPGSESLARLKTHPQRTIITILIGSNVITVAASILAADAAVQAFGNAGLGIATFAMTLVLLTFDEITPKSLASVHAEAFALLASPVLEVLQVLLTPLVFAFEAFIRLIPGTYSKKAVRLTEEEIRSTVTLGAQDEAITQKEKQYIENVLHFNDKTVADCMTYKTRAVAFSPDWTVETALRHGLSTAYSRFPVVSSGRAHGLVTLKSLVRAAATHPRQTVGQHMRRTVVVYSGSSASDAFSHMQKKAANMALVVDAKVRYVGIVTLEDLLEEMVGELV